MCVLTLVKQRRTHTARKLCGLPRCVATCPTPGPIEADNESPAPLPKESCAGFGKILYRGCGSALVEPSLRELALLPLPQNLGSILETSRPPLTAAARRSGSAGAGPLKVCVCFFIYICTHPPLRLPTHRTGLEKRVRLHHALSVLFRIPTDQHSPPFQPNCSQILSLSLSLSDNLRIEAVTASCFVVCWWPNELDVLYIPVRKISLFFLSLSH